jgi:hypothetical protein
MKHHEPSSVVSSRIDDPKRDAGQYLLADRHACEEILARPGHAERGRERVRIGHGRQVQHAAPVGRQVSPERQWNQAGGGVFVASGACSRYSLTTVGNLQRVFEVCHGFQSCSSRTPEQVAIVHQ